MNLEQIKADAEAATPGPWVSYHTHGWLVVEAASPRETGICQVAKGLGSIKDKATARHIANCDPQTILKLLALVESADNYYRRYCQGEAAETGPEDTGCTLAQHEDALSLRDALAALAALDKS